MKRSFFILISGIWILTSGFSPAIIDTNNNGVSDLWEKSHNSGNLFTTFAPNADPDSDGWTNAQEATAGTDPFDANAPAGCLRPAINHIPAVYLPPEEEGGPAVLATPEAVTLTWPTVAGKQYTLLFSADLSSGSWFPVGDPRIGNGTEMGNGIPLTQPDGSTPASVFWRVLHSWSVRCASRVLSRYRLWAELYNLHAGLQRRLHCEPRHRWLPVAAQCHVEQRHAAPCSIKRCGPPLPRVS